MGQQLVKEQTRRRLHGKDPRYDWRPFDGWNYGYGDLRDNTLSWSIWALVTLGSFQVDWREAAIILGASTYFQEKWGVNQLFTDPSYRALSPEEKAKWNALYSKPENKYHGGGSSWIHNIQAGYCFYHWFFRNNKKLFVRLGVLSEAIGDTVSVSGIMGKYDDRAHGEGLAIGIASAFILDNVFSKKRALY